MNRRGRGRPPMLADAPKTILEFMDRFSTEERCAEYLFRLRWPKGFRCPKCGEGERYRRGLRRLECKSCRAETSLTAGTVLHKTRTPLRVWFWAAWMMSRSKQGISANELARQTGIRQEDAWLLLQKLRYRLEEKHPLEKLVEVDEAYVGGVERGKPGGRTHGQKALVAVAVENRGRSAGRARLQMIDNASKRILGAFVATAVLKAPTTRVKTDGWVGYNGLKAAGYNHRAVPEETPENASHLFPWVHRVISLLKAWLHGTFRSVSKRYLPQYLREFVYRLNRRSDEPSIFPRLLARAMQNPTVTNLHLQSEFGG